MDEYISTKVPANPIPNNQYERFKLKLEEYSARNSERNLMLFILGIATGYRSQDLVDLTISQIRQALNDGEFIIQEKKQYRAWLTHMKDHPDSKKKKPDARPAPIKKTLNKLLKDYVKNKKASEYAFPSQKGNGNEYISEKSYSDILSDVGKGMGLKHISGHSMRKTFGNRIWETTKDIEKVRIALGHKSIEVTKRYLGIANTVINDAAEIVDDFI
jgi:integrase